MPPPAPKPKNKPTEQTFEEPKYLRRLIDGQIPVNVKLDDDSIVSGVIEYYDTSFIRITRKGKPNLFLFKHHIKYISEA